VTRLGAFVAHARTVAAEARARVAAAVSSAGDPDLAGALVLVTCHRVELVGPADVVEAATRSIGTRDRLAVGGLLPHDDAVRHVVRLAVGLESAVVGEDQILHQLRTAAREARGRSPLDPALDQLLDRALRAGRRARTWLPPRRPTLADAALDLSLGAGARLAAERTVLVVGAGAMGRLAAFAARARGCRVVVASRTRARADRLAAAVGGAATTFDPDPDVLAGVDAIVVALAGEWPIGEPTRRLLGGLALRVVDLSAPPSVPAAVVAALGDRHASIDDLAAGPASVDPELAGRLERLVEETVAGFAAWAAAEADRSLVRALVDRASDARSAELDALWRRVPGLDEPARAEIARMAAQLTDRLLRDPLERLGEDADGRRGRAAQELFRL
jgi:glutamyl-tRNA reductase